MPLPDPQRHLDLLSQLLGSGPVGLVDHENVRDLHHTRLERLDPVARFGHQHQHGRVRHPGHVQLRLAHAHGLDQDPVEPGGIEQIADLAGGGGQAAERAAGGHGADVDALVQGDGFHADAVAEEGAAGERAGGIDRDHRHLEPGGAVGGDEALDQGGLPGPGRAGDADAAGFAEGAVDLGEELFEAGPAVLDHRDRPGQCGGFAGNQLGDQEIEVHG